jgi:hypothetical protein
MVFSRENDELVIKPFAPALEALHGMTKQMAILSQGIQKLGKKHSGIQSVRGVR